jgi:hypothetical protein
MLTPAFQAVPLPLRSFLAEVRVPLQPDAANRVSSQAADDPWRRMRNAAKIPLSRPEKTGNRSRFFGIMRDFAGQSGTRKSGGKQLESGFFF